MTTSEHIPDNELVRLYLNNKDKKAAEILVRRYYNRVFKRFLSSVGQDADAHDLCQQLWLKLFKNLNSYKEQGKFENYVNFSASNLLRDYWRVNGGKYLEAFDEFHHEVVEDKEQALATKNAVFTLVNELIPKLSLELRLVFLLKHESEFWEDNHPLRWHHLGELNGLRADKTRAHFRSARDKLIRSSQQKNSNSSLTQLELLIFLVWTQSQRGGKSMAMTEKYLAELVGIPVNTFKTRYRAAKREIKNSFETS